MNEISKCTQCGGRHIVSETCEQYKVRVADLMKGIESIKSGFGGILPNGNIVDRRIRSDAMPIPENSMFGAPKPKDVTLKDAGDWKQEMDYRAMYGDRYVHNSGLPPAELAEKVVIVGAGNVGKSTTGKFPILPDEVKDMVTLVSDDNKQMKDVMSKLITPIQQAIPYRPSKSVMKTRGKSNKKYSVRKKAKNDRTKKRRK